MIVLDISKIQIAPPTFGINLNKLEGLFVRDIASDKLPPILITTKLDFS